MKIVLCHYHLHQGGVSQVVINQIDSLLSTVSKKGKPVKEILVLYGDNESHSLCEKIQRRAQSSIPVHFKNIPELSYDNDNTKNLYFKDRTSLSAASQTLTQKIIEVLQGFGFKKEETLLHFHNHSLGKNAALPLAIWLLAIGGSHLILQIHDFLEDLRPNNFQYLSRVYRNEQSDNLAALLYPLLPNIHYFTLTDRDRQLLIKANVPPDAVQTIPNPATEFPPLPSRYESREKLADLFSIPQHCQLILYPIRAIRRKNLGELLLWARLADRGSRHIRFLVTLPPEHEEASQYPTWKDLIQRLQLPVVLETAVPGKLTFHENLAAADTIISTSVAEGFGMVFLESWQIERPLIGRVLPDIGEEFQKAGIITPYSQKTIDLPVSWLGEKKIKEQLQQIYSQTCSDYQRPAPSVDWGKFMTDDLVDFGRLPFLLQREILLFLDQEPELSLQIRQLNPWIDQALQVAIPSANLHRQAITPKEAFQEKQREVGSKARRLFQEQKQLEQLLEKNRLAIKQNYSLKSIGNRLQAIYTDILASAQPPRKANLKAIKKNTTQTSSLLDDLLLYSESLPTVSGKVLLDFFLSPDRFYPVRVT